MIRPQPLSRHAILVRALFVITLIAALALAFLPHPPRMPTDRMGDKFNHMLAFSVLSALATLAWPRAPRWLIVERLSFVGALIEVVQALPGLHRDCDIRDWIADTVAIVVVTLLVRWWQTRPKPPQAA